MRVPPVARTAKLITASTISLFICFRLSMGRKLTSVLYLTVLAIGTVRANPSEKQGGSLIRLAAASEFVRHRFGEKWADFRLRGPCYDPPVPPRADQRAAEEK
jgi:hypothetical protein